MLTLLPRPSVGALQKPPNMGSAGPRECLVVCTRVGDGDLVAM